MNYNIACMQSRVIITRPILKWVGGKTQIIDAIIREFPANMHNYHELFLGGGSVLLALLSHQRAGVIAVTGDIYAYDANEPLIAAYKNIQASPDELYAQIQRLIADFANATGDVIDRQPATLDAAMQSKENFYYWTRAQYNALPPADKLHVRGSALFIFLNKTCFRGVFRVGPRGFNVPYGHYVNPEIINRDHLNAVSVIIRPVKFACADFTVAAKPILPGDFVYMDPPYAPENATSFVGYTAGGFLAEHHRQLFAICNDLTTSGTKCLVSNADVPLVRQHFTADAGYTTAVINCRRSINSKKPAARTNEVIIKNY